MKREIIHNIEDLKLSVQAELDRVYKLFMEKYAVFKTEIMEIKRLREEIETDLELRRMTPTNNGGRYSTNPSPKLSSNKSSTASIQSNTQLIKSM